MRYDINSYHRRIGDEFYFTVVREDGVEGVIQINMRYVIETDFEDHIEWEDE